MPDLRRRGYCRAQGAPRKHLLRVHQLSEVRLYLELEAGQAKMPECGSPYLIEKTRAAGVYLVCPNNRKSAAEDEAPKKRAKKGAAAEAEVASQVVCTYARKIAEPQMESVEAMRYQTKAEALPVA